MTKIRGGTWTGQPSNFFWQVDSISIKKYKKKKMRFNDPHFTLSFWKFFYKCRKISVGPKKWSSWNALKKFCAKNLFDKNWNFSQSNQRWPSEGRLCLNLENFQKFSKQNFRQNFIQGISRRKFFGPYRNFPRLVKFSKNLKSSVEG